MWPTLFAAGGRGRGSGGKTEKKKEMGERKAKWWLVVCTCSKVGLRCGLWALPYLLTPGLAFNNIQIKRPSRPPLDSCLYSSVIALSYIFIFLPALPASVVVLIKTLFSSSDLGSSSPYLCLPSPLSASFPPPLCPISDLVLCFHVPSPLTSSFLSCLREAVCGALCPHALGASDPHVGYLSSCLPARMVLLPFPFNWRRVFLFFCFIHFAFTWLNTRTVQHGRQRAGEQNEQDMYNPLTSRNLQSCWKDRYTKISSTA